MKVAEYLTGLGTPFETYLSQDSGNRSYGFSAPEGPRWVKVLDCIKTPIPNAHDVIEFYNSLHSRMIPRRWRLVEFSDGLVMEHEWVPGRVLRSPDEDKNGSSRFMAPEEFRRGAVIDHRTNVFTMGATGFVLLNDNRRREADWPLSGETFRVLARATSERTEERQESIGQFCREWRRALGNAP
jgi:hypothetical protein